MCTCVSALTVRKCLRSSDTAEPAQASSCDGELDAREKDDVPLVPWTLVIKTRRNGCASILQKIERDTSGKSGAVCCPRRLVMPSKRFNKIPGQAKSSSCSRNPGIRLRNGRFAMAPDRNRQWLFLGQWVESSPLWWASLFRSRWGIAREGVSDMPEIK